MAFENRHVSTVQLTPTEVLFVQLTAATVPYIFVGPTPPSNPPVNTLWCDTS